MTIEELYQWALFYKKTHAELYYVDGNGNYNAVTNNKLVPLAGCNGVLIGREPLAMAKTTSR